MKSAEQMIAPVRCAPSHGGCGQVFDLCDGTPVARYADCTVFTTPCCGRQTDDRPLGWGGGVEKLTREEARLAVHGGIRRMSDGQIVHYPANRSTPAVAQPRTSGGDDA